MVSLSGYSKKLICLLTILLVAGCTSGSLSSVSSEEFRRPLKDIRKAVHYTLKSKISKKSENDRTYFSAYHRVGTNLKLSAYKQKERGQVIVTINGDRRPYWITVKYRIDSLNGGKYEPNRYDKGLAQKYLDRATEYLASRPEERDIIDDFRPY